MLRVCCIRIIKIIKVWTFYDKLQPNFGQEKLHCHYMDSEMKSTPIILRVKQNIKILRVDEIIGEEDRHQDDNIITQWG